MSHREYVMQRIHDKIATEERQEAAMDQKLIADNARLMRRLTSR